MRVDFGARTANKATGQREGEGEVAWKQSPLVNFGALRVVVVAVVVAFLPAQRAQTDNVAVFRFVCVFFFCSATCNLPHGTYHLPLATLDKVLSL